VLVSCATRHFEPRSFGVQCDVVIGIYLCYAAQKVGYQSPLKHWHTMYVRSSFMAVVVTLPTSRFHSKLMQAFTTLNVHSSGRTGTSVVAYRIIYYHILRIAKTSIILSTLHFCSYIKPSQRPLARIFQPCALKHAWSYTHNDFSYMTPKPKNLLLSLIGVFGPTRSLTVGTYRFI